MQAGVSAERRGPRQRLAANCALASTGGACLRWPTFDGHNLFEPPAIGSRPPAGNLSACDKLS